MPGAWEHTQASTHAVIYLHFLLLLQINQTCNWYRSDAKHMRDVAAVRIHLLFIKLLHTYAVHRKRITAIMHIHRTEFVSKAAFQLQFDCIRITHIGNRNHFITIAFIGAQSSFYPSRPVGWLHERKTSKYAATLRFSLPSTRNGTPFPSRCRAIHIDGARSIRMC